MRRILTTGALAALMSIALPVFQLHAQDGPGATQERLARELREQGVEAARSGDWVTARGHFQQSYDLDPRILTLYNLAAAQLNSGALVEADENFRQFLRATSDGTHAEFRAESERSRANLATRIAKLTVRIDNLDPSDRVEIGGQEFAQAALGVELPMNPGFHRVAVFREGRQVAEETITLSEGASSSLSVDVPALEVSAVNVPTAAETAAASEANGGSAPLGEEVDEGGSSGVLIGVLAGVVVVAGLIVGGYFLFRGDDEEPFQGSLGTVDFR